MLAKTLSFASPGALSTVHEQLVYAGEDGVRRTFPIEDLGFVMLETPRVTLTAAVLQKFAATNVALVVCDEKHLPAAQLTPFAAHATAQETVRAQLAASDAVQGRLWRQIVRAKIRNQAALLERLGKNGAKRLRVLADETKNHDETHCEAQAARIYFQALLPSDVVRERQGDWPNAALDYGYAVLRAAVARALVGSGLLCLRGVHHHNRYDPLCLADDAMEPFRPFVDQYVFGGEAPFDEPQGDLMRDVRAKLLEALACDVRLDGLLRPLSVAAVYVAASLARFYLGKDDALVLPSFP